MAVKVVQGIVGSQDLNVQQFTSPKNRVQEELKGQSSQAGIQAALSRVVSSSDAVITAVKQLRGQGPVESPRDIKDAQAKAEKVAENIRENKEEALSAHSGLDGARSSQVLVSSNS